MNVNSKFKNVQEYKICQGGKNIVNLGIIENFNTHYSQIPIGINFYPSQNSNYEELLQKIASYTNCNINNILITNGSGKGLDLILHTFTTPETMILIPTPNYPGFIHSSQISNGNIITQEFYGNESEYDQLKISESDIVYFSTPNLPLGYTINRDKIIDYVKLYPNKLFIIDEAYFEYSSKESFSTLITNKNIIITRTFSKAFALAGARIGYILANPALIQIMLTGYNAKDVLDSSVEYALDVLKNKEYYINNVKNDIKLSEYIDTELGKIVHSGKCIYNYTTLQAPWFLIFSQHPQYVCNVMKIKGYLVRNKSDEIKDCVRISLCTKDHIDKVINIIREINIQESNIYNVIFLDLDITLRKDYKSDISIKLQKIINDLQKKYEIIIITDNYQNNEDTKRYLINNNITCSLISPISHLMNPDNKKWFIYDNAVYIIQYPDDLYDVLNAVNNYKLIRVIETDETINSGELGVYPNIILPHIGVVLNFINQYNTGIKIEIIGKSTLQLNQYKQTNALMIGDSKNDELFAHNNNYQFIKVDTYIDTLKELIKIHV